MQSYKFLLDARKQPAKKQATKKKPPVKKTDREEKTILEKEGIISNATKAGLRHSLFHGLGNGWALLGWRRFAVI